MRCPLTPFLRQHARTTFLACFSGLLLAPCVCQGQVDAATALAGMKTPPDVSVSLFAAEPDLRNPTAMDIDAQGRVWITEAVNYRLFKHEVADDLGDRIRVLEDTDGDGRCDKAWTYHQDPSLQAPLGIAVLGDRVYVCQSPDLFYLEDTDGDGRADRKTVILTGFGGVDHDHAIHGLHFGPDGWLYLSVGDGSASFDPFDNGQDRSTLLGAVLRIDVREASAAEPYRVPADNPFVDDATARGELWAYGLRNPWRMAFDAETGALWLGDVGPSTREEVNRIERGGNYGWDLFEGTACLDARPNCDGSGLTFPVAEYEHAEGRCAVIGGEVYRGDAFPELRGHYLYADFCSGELWALDGEGAEPVLLASGPASMVSFGADQDRELYLLTHSGEAWRLVPR